MLVSYHDNSDKELYFAFSETAFPDEESDWTRHIVIEDDNLGHGSYQDMVLVNANPALVFFDQPDSSTINLRYMRSLVAQPDSGTDWGIDYVIPTGNYEPSQGLSAEIINGRPAVCTLAVDSNGYVLLYLYATSADPTSPSQWTMVEVAGDNAVGGATLPELLDYSGVPMIFFQHEFLDSDVFHPALAWANSATPTDWCIEYRCAGNDVTVDYTGTICLHGGKPALSFYNSAAVIYTLTGN
jgi:hypothetical protein